MNHIKQITKTAITLSFIGLLSACVFDPAAGVFVPVGPAVRPAPIRPAPGPQYRPGGNRRPHYRPGPYCRHDGCRPRRVW